MTLANRIKGLQRAQTIARSLWLVLAMCIIPLPAAAVNVTVGGTTYDISFTTTNFDDSIALLEGQPWWGNPTLADNIITQYASVDGGDTGVDFGVVALDFAVRRTVTDPALFIDVRVVQGGVGPTPTTIDRLVTVDFAIATVVPAVPEIDGNALPKALFILFTLWLWLQVRRGRRVAGPGAVG